MAFVPAGTDSYLCPQVSTSGRWSKRFVAYHVSRFLPVILPMQMLPTSHHLAFAVQYITLSGVLLLRCVAYGNQAGLVEAVIIDAEKCVDLLEGMEDIWSGAKRCKEIVSDLLVVVKTRHYGGLSALDTIQTTKVGLRYFTLPHIRRLDVSCLALQRGDLHQFRSVRKFPGEAQIPSRVRGGGLPFASSA